MDDRVKWPTGRDEEAALIIRTDYGDEPAWEAVRAALMTARGEIDDIEPFVHVVDDPEWAGATPADVLHAASTHAERHEVVYLADGTSMHGAPVTLLALSLLTRDRCEDDEEFEAYGGSFRVVPYGIHEMNANLMIASMDFGDFTDAARSDPEGVFRGFSGAPAA
ncbi:hypothetical protein ACFC51_26685 [Streptomyces sp. NPDC055962]|uniref:DUF6924 domain-containing protein n=1 Tax=Streptomyces sp. NPDC055962 TaxID=3345667 RepID=UPI0035D78EFC